MALSKNVALVEQLEKHPSLLARVEQLLQIVDGDGNEEHDIKLADDAEDAVVDNLRKFGKELLTEWGQKQELKACQNSTKVNRMLKPHSKKNCTGIPHTEK